MDQIVARRDRADAVAEQIMHDIEKRGLKAGERVGSERELADNYDVSRWVIRGSLEILATRGVVLRVTGRTGGVYVAPQKIVRDLTELVGLPAYLHAQGVVSGTTMLGARVRAATTTLAQALDISEGEWVFQIERLRIADGLPLSMETCSFPAELFPGLLDQPLTGSLYELLEKRYGIKRGQAVETVSAAAADKHQANVLQVTQGAPLLIVERQARLASGTLFEHSWEMYRAERVSFAIQTRAGSLSSLQLHDVTTRRSPRKATAPNTS